VDSVDGFLANANISTEFVGIILLPLIKIARKRLMFCNWLNLDVLLLGPVTMALNTQDSAVSTSTAIFNSGIVSP
jgi:hypothetical protein